MNRPGRNSEAQPLPRDCAVREAPPTTVSETERRAFDRIAAAGIAPSGASGGEPIRVVLGIDFGTSSTKIIVRFPDEPGESTVAVPAPDHCRSQEERYLWRTLLWARQDGEFIAYPETDARPLCSLKTDAIGCSSHYAQVDANPLQAAAAYLAFAIRYAKGHLVSEHFPSIRGRTPVWLVNVGLPAAHYDDQDLTRSYRHAAAAALKLAETNHSVSNEAISRVFVCTDVQNAALSAEYAEKSMGLAVVPETAAAATAFAKSSNAADGLYLMIDVGALTLDICTFRIKREKDGREGYPIMEADVQNLGVEALHWFYDASKDKDKFRDRVNMCIWEIIRKTKQDRDPRAAAFKQENSLPVFLAGGGSVNPLHCEIIDSCSAAMKRYWGNEGISILDLPPPRPALGENPADLGRLAVAWGLSYPRDEIGEIIPPSEILDVDAPVIKDYTENYISKDRM